MAFSLFPAVWMHMRLSAEASSVAHGALNPGARDPTLCVQRTLAYMHYALFVPSVRAGPSSSCLRSSGAGKYPGCRML